MLHTDFQGKNVTVLGVGISNTPLLSFLLDHGAIVTARDKKTFDLLPEAAKALKDRGVNFVNGEDYLKDIRADYVFRSPGIRYDKPEILKAIEEGAILTSEMELFFEECPCTLIGVTGSDGKTTTTTLISKALAMQYGEEHVYVGGNIGRPLLPVVEQMTKDDFAVVELSSFQLHTMKRSPDIAVITNISPNHLDWHTGMDEYIASKKNIFLHQKNSSRLVLNKNNAITASMEHENAPGTTVTMFNDPDGIYLREDGMIVLHGVNYMEASDILIPGRHNVDNYMTMIAALEGLVSNENVKKLARTFGGVEHRCELVAEIGGVSYYNSSIDSSPTRTLAALSNFKKKPIVIMGGYDKHIPFDPLALPVCEKCKAVILTGATGEKIGNVIRSCPAYRENNPYLRCVPDFRAAVEAARDLAESGDIVLLSPACASFDAFPNFEVRGNTFKEIVRSFAEKK